MPAEAGNLVKPPTQHENHHPFNNIPPAIPRHTPPTVPFGAKGTRWERSDHRRGWRRGRGPDGRHPHHYVTHHHITDHNLQFPTNNLNNPKNPPSNQNLPTPHLPNNLIPQFNEQPHSNNAHIHTKPNTPLKIPPTHPQNTTPTVPFRLKRERAQHPSPSERRGRDGSEATIAGDGGADEGPDGRNPARLPNNHQQIHQSHKSQFRQQRNPSNPIP